MPLFRRWNDLGGLWGIWRVTESMEELRARLDDSLFYDKELLELKSASRRMEYVAVRVLLKELLGREVRILHELSGKPFLEDRSCKITVSHTKGYVAIGLHASLELGMDIERRTEKVNKVRSRFVRDDEMLVDENISAADKLSLLLLHWSAKETLYKLINLQGVDFLKHMRIFNFSLLPAGSFRAEEYRTPQRYVFEVSYWIHPDFVCTWSVHPVSAKA